ncbi:hypothetical protein KLP40_20240 [Hymenobacter sp. NST-14]|uniref:hypothetical protein n=1 Tax=Hymenobacter piscis TaxID=2839984 RepID=UPI001C0260B0|nr:hypothetical protein [Hymenobacter piscis]MBT9395506.1 hypothetical protein [Hymenobacter piscis]
MPFIRTHKNLLPVLLLAALSVYTILTVLSVPVYQGEEAYQRTFTLPHYGAFVAVLLLLAAYFQLRPLFRPLVLLTLALTLVGALNFLPDSLKLGLGFGDASLGVSILGVALGLLYYLPNRPAAHAFIRGLLFPPPSPAQAAQRQRASIDQFKQTFARRSDENLQLMLQERQLLPAALAAAQELLQERKANAPGV